MTINKCSSDKWRLKIYKFVQFRTKAVNIIVKSKIDFAVSEVNYTNIKMC